MPEGALVSGRRDTSDALARLVGRIGSIRDRFGRIDALLVSGDLSNDGSAESYTRLKSLIAPLYLPLSIAPGNHDARDAMQAAYDKNLPDTGALNRTRQIGGIQLIGLDTLVEGQGGGTLSPDTLAFLQSALAKADGGPVLLVLHHPPFACGIRFIDDIGLTNRDALGEVLTDYSGALRLVCGNIHSMIVSDVAGHIALSAPSSCSTFAQDLRPDAPVGYMAQEDGCLLHRWESGFQSIRIGPVAGTGPFPF
ncbi:MAG: metallophosphoesterase [Tateyamaria sp.]